jgi:hypothetical protein
VACRTRSQQLSAFQRSVESRWQDNFSSISNEICLLEFVRGNYIDASSDNEFDVNNNNGNNIEPSSVTTIIWLVEKN